MTVTSPFLGVTRICQARSWPWAASTGLLSWSMEAPLSLDTPRTATIPLTSCRPSKAMVRPFPLTMILWRGQRLSLAFVQLDHLNLLAEPLPEWFQGMFLPGTHWTLAFVKCLALACLASQNTFVQALCRGFPNSLHTGSHHCSCSFQFSVSVYRGIQQWLDHRGRAV